MLAVSRGFAPLGTTSEKPNNDIANVQNECANE